MEEGRDMQAEYKTPVLGGGPETSSFPALSSVMAASGTTWDLGVHRAWWKAWGPSLVLMWVSFTTMASEPLHLFPHL